MIPAVRYEVDSSHLRVPAAGLVFGGLLLAHLPTSVGLPCPLRTVTGIPCPFCGLTTSIRALGGGHLSASLRAAPLGLIAAGVAVVTLTGLVPRTIRLPVSALAFLVAGEWIFELARFHVI